MVKFFRSYSLVLSVLLWMFLIVLPGRTALSVNCDSNNYIDGTYCPCQEDDAYASVCGLVSTSEITHDMGTINPRAAYFSARTPLAGVTVTIYENNPNSPTGKVYGKLDRKLVETSTSDTEGKYYLRIRRITPRNSVYVVFSCGGKVDTIKIIPSVRDMLNLDVDVRCTGEQDYTPLPEEIDLTDRDNILGCTSSYPDKRDVYVGTEEPSVQYFDALVGQEGVDTRFVPFEGYSLFNKSSGAIAEKDCIIRYTLKNDRSGIVVGPSYNSVLEKCGLEGYYNEDDFVSRPLRFDLPEKEEDFLYRTWELRFNMTRKYQEPMAPAQYNHLMYGDCIGDVYLRHYKSEGKDTPIYCEDLEMCIHTAANPFRNMHTTMSFGARLASPITWFQLSQEELRPPEDILCRKRDTLEDVKISEVQPLITDDHCTPGESGCQYKLDKSFLLPQFYLSGGGGLEQLKTETIGDSYGGPERKDKFNLSSTEAKKPHSGGSVSVMSDPSIAKNNSITTSIGISSTIESVGIMTDRYSSPVDVYSGSYDYTADFTVIDLGRDITSLCNLSSVNDTFHVSNKQIEEESVINNTFIGDSDDQVKSDSGSPTATYATTKAKARDRSLAQLHVNWLYDVWDSVHRIVTADLSNLDVWKYVLESLLSGIFGRNPENPYKSFAMRMCEEGGSGEDCIPWTEETPAYIKVDYCLAEDTFESNFPALGEPGFGSYSNNACYPWEDVSDEDGDDYCYSWPGPKSRWNQEVYGKIPSFAEGGWPGIYGQIRTCRVTKCKRVWKERECDEFIYVYNKEGKPVKICSDSNGNGEIETKVDIKSEDCVDESEKNNCLIEQRNTWYLFEPKNAEQKKRQDNDLDDPDPLDPPNYNKEQGATSLACKLQRAGPMKEDVDLTKGHLGRVLQQPLQGNSQLVADKVPQSANYSAMRFLSPVETRIEGLKGVCSDYANTMDKNNIEGGVHMTTTGDCIPSYVGTGNIEKILNIVAHPERPSILYEDFQDMYQSCNPDNRDSGNWCAKVLPPAKEKIDLDSLEPGSCAAKCNEININGNIISLAPLMRKIVGSAGKSPYTKREDITVPGGVILAAMAGEGAFGGLWDWSKDENIEKWSSAWYGRMPMNTCNESVASATAPFGLFESDENFAKGNGGYHPSRRNPEGEVIISRCNFLDGAYILANAIAKGEGHLSCNNKDMNEAKAAIEMFEYGTAGGTLPDRVIEVLTQCL